MKNLSKTLGLIGVFLFLTSVIFKHFHLAGAGVILSLSIVLGLIFYVSEILSKEIKALNGIDQAIGYSLLINMIVFLGAFLFKMMHWPGANILLGLSMIFLVIFIIIGAIGIYPKEKKASIELTNVNTITIMYMAIVLIMFGLRSIS
ncbi:MAG: hypothetical protein HOD63_17705 [Bacteroidetes bacterium]|jgi:hypothetical protein|nr:hypothetical protein [Bacteroidota bacterium]MBT5527946.1 hypothetical protein [Cytophagia bacterium]MBT3423376.1 hypothetical protein [Bacteroidota bacterium]MBT3799964.1 hypothetical protein [Bacteroidota bacterium]MBT3933815.1 hypothetical protein [Bacteroidota bacterium]